MFFNFIKKQKEEDYSGYSINDICKITDKAISDEKKYIQKCQRDYYKELDRKIFVAASYGDSSIITHSIDGYYPYMTEDFLQEIARVYQSKGYEVTVIQPIKDEPKDKWLRISWEKRIKRS